MLDPKRFEYDAATSRLTYDTGLSGKSLVPRDTAKALGAIARSGTHDGKTIAELHATFGDQAAAVYNADPLAFVGVVSAGPEGVAPSAATFPARADFGIDEA